MSNRGDRPRTRIYDRIDLPQGHLTVRRIDVIDWGSTLVVSCAHEYPPHNRTTPFQLIFRNCRGIHWYVQNRPAVAEDAPAQLLTHDLGQQNYQRTARLATTRAELIIAYGTLDILMDNDTEGS